MKNVVLTGIGGQGTVLAAKILAQAAQARGWHVRTAETIGMAQRGGSVVSHVRMGDEGETVASPLVPRGTADMLVAFEPGEGARMAMSGILKEGGVMVTASRVVQPVTASLSRDRYEAAVVLDALRAKAEKAIEVDVSTSGHPAENDSAFGQTRIAGVSDSEKCGMQECGRPAANPIGTLYVVEEAPILECIGNAKALNIVLLSVAVHAGVLGLDEEELKEAISACVKPRFKEMNLAAVDAVGALLAR